MLGWEPAFRAGAASVGGKGWNLSRLARYGFRVPTGGVLSAQTYEELCQQPQIAADISTLSHVKPEHVTDAEVRQQLARLRERFLQATVPALARQAIDRFLDESGLTDRPVAVRSSAVAEDTAGMAFAGIHDSVLGVIGSDAVAASALRCYASLWTPHAIAYRRRFEVDDTATPCAVVICELIGDASVGPEAAGVAFSCDPVTGERGTITINLAAGPGGAVVDGRIEPQQYRVRWTERVPIIDRTDQTGMAPVLNDDLISELTRLVIRVHWALGDGDQAQDVEWAWDGGTFWLLQARPVTRVPRRTFPGVPTTTVTWSNANVRDSFPRPLSTMTWSLIDVAAQDIVYASLRVVGYSLPRGMEVLRRHRGRPYFDLDSLQWGLYDALGISPTETTRTLGGFQREIPIPKRHPLWGRTGLARFGRRLRLLSHLRRLRRSAPARIDAMIRRARETRATDLRVLDNHTLLQRLYELLDAGRDYQPVLQLAASYCGMWIMILQDLLERMVGDRAQAMVGRLLAHSGGVASAEHGYLLEEMAPLLATEPAARQALESGDPFAWKELPADSGFRSAMERYLEQFGHRAVFEMELASPRWNEDPRYLLEQIRFHAERPDDQARRSRAAQVRRHAEASLTDVPTVARPLVRWILAHTRRGAALRENAKSGSAAGMAFVRTVGLEIGRRLRDRGRLESADDVFHLSITEALAFLDNSWDGVGANYLVRDRKNRLADQEKLDPPGVIEDTPDQRSGDQVSGPIAPTPGGSIRWPGVAAAPGCATGSACVLVTPHDGHRLERRDVLVAPSTDPGWTPLFLRASAVVMETGGYLSHGAVVARELGLPAVVNVRDAMRTIASGDTLDVDGDAGTVTRRGHDTPS